MLACFGQVERAVTRRKLADYAVSGSGRRVVAIPSGGGHPWPDPTYAALNPM